MKYLKNGQEVEVVSQFDGGFVVESIYERDGKPFAGDRKVVKEVFDSPPVERISKDVLEMQSKQRDLSKQLTELRDEIRTATAERQNLLESIKQHPALKRIDDFIAGRFTHIVKESYGTFTIVAVDSDEFRVADRSYDRSYKLITLYGRMKGDLGFRINQYSDGSGSNCQCWLCHSEQEAKNLVTEQINEQLKKEPASRACWFEYYEKSLVAIGLPVPQQITDKLREVRISNATLAQAKAQADLDKANAEFAKVIG